MLLYRASLSFVLLLFGQTASMQDESMNTSKAPQNTAIQEQPRPDIDLNKPYIGEETQSEAQTISQEPSVYVYRPRKSIGEYSQTPMAKRKRKKQEQIRQKGGKEHADFLSKQKNYDRQYSYRHNEITKQLGISMRSKNIKSRGVTLRVRQGIASEEDLKFFEARRQRAIKGGRARTARLQEARLAVQQGNTTPAHLTELEKRKRKDQQYRKSRRKDAKAGKTRLE